MQNIVHRPLQVERVTQFCTVTAGMYWSLACCQFNNGTVYCSQHKGKFDSGTQPFCSLFILLTGFTVAIS